MGVPALLAKLDRKLVPTRSDSEDQGSVRRIGVNCWDGHPILKGLRINRGLCCAAALCDRERGISSTGRQATSRTACGSCAPPFCPGVWTAYRYLGFTD